jgi:hypothetical protein
MRRLIRPWAPTLALGSVAFVLAFVVMPSLINPKTSVPTFSAANIGDPSPSPSEPPSLGVAAPLPVLDTPGAKGATARITTPAKAPAKRTKKTAAPRRTAPPASASPTPVHVTPVVRPTTPPVTQAPRPVSQPKPTPTPTPKPSTPTFDSTGSFDSQG